MWEEENFLAIKHEQDCLEDIEEKLDTLLKNLKNVNKNLSENRSDIFLIIDANKLIEEVKKHRNSRNIPEFKEIFIEIDDYVKQLDELINYKVEVNGEFFAV